MSTATTNAGAGLDSTVIPLVGHVASDLGEQELQRLAEEPVTWRRAAVASVAVLAAASTLAFAAAAAASGRGGSAATGPRGRDVLGFAQQGLHAPLSGNGLMGDSSQPGVAGAVAALGRFDDGSGIVEMNETFAVKERPWVQSFRRGFQQRPTATNMHFFGHGCCRFDGWQAKDEGYQTEHDCVAKCAADSNCLAADIARPRGGRYHCFTFYGSNDKNFRTECGRSSLSEKCFRKKDTPPRLTLEEETCAQYCRNLKYCCNDPGIGSNQHISCAQACMVRLSGLSQSECKSHCDRNSRSGCSKTIGRFRFTFCQACKDLTSDPKCKFGVSSPQACIDGCEYSDSSGTGQFEPLNHEFIIDGTGPSGVADPVGRGITNRSCVRNGGKVNSFKNKGPVGCNLQCVKERESGEGCRAMEHDLNGPGEGTCNIFTQPVRETEPKQGVTCSRRGSGGEFPKSNCPKGTPSKSVSSAKYPHDIMTRSSKCTRPVIQTTCMTHGQYDDITRSVRTALRNVDDRCTAKSCPQADWAGCVLRMAGHDFMDYVPGRDEGQSGSNACTDMSHPDNTGLLPCLSTGEHGQSLKSIYEKFCTSVSLADFIVVAAEAVMTETREHVLRDDPEAAPTDFKTHFRFGRKTATACPGSATLLPDPEDGCDAVRETFVQHMQLTFRDAAALMGVHTLGRARPENSGYDGWWSDPINSRKFNNNYYISMAKKGWRPMKAVCGNEKKNQWFKSGPGGILQGAALEMMLDTDICLAFSNADPGKQNVTEDPGLPVKASRDNCCAWLIQHPVTENPLGLFTEICGLHDVHDCGSIRQLKGFGAAGEHIFEFSESEFAWLDAFMHAWGKATENGYFELKKLRTRCQ